MVKVGQAVQFVPSFMVIANTSRRDRRAPEASAVDGKVFKVNRNGVIHIGFTVGGVTMRESFTAFDFGRKVRTVR